MNVVFVFRSYEASMLVVIVTIALVRVMIICDNHNCKDSRNNNNNNNNNNNKNNKNNRSDDKHNVNNDKHNVNNGIILDNHNGNGLDINHYYIIIMHIIKLMALYFLLL